MSSPLYGCEPTAQPQSQFRPKSRNGNQAFPNSPSDESDTTLSDTTLSDTTLSIHDIPTPSIPMHDPNQLDTRYHNLIKKAESHQPTSEEQQQTPTPDPASPSTLPNTPKQSAHAHSAAVASSAGTLFKAWGRTCLENELQELRRSSTLDPSSVDAAVFDKGTFVRNCLRLKYRAYIQQVAEKPTAEKEFTAACQHPACGHQFVSGECRVSFEPGVWTQPVRDGVTTRSEEVLLDLDFDPRKEPEKLLAVPDYRRLANEVNVDMYGVGEMYCVGCFEVLLELVPPAEVKTSKKRKGSPDAKRVLRPSPLCRNYTVVFPETRLDPEGLVGLGEEVVEVVEAWKARNLREGLKKMGDMYDFLKVPKGEEGEEAEFPYVPAVLWVEGAGLAECLSAMGNDTTAVTGPVGKTEKNKKRKKKSGSKIAQKEVV